jgi:hypothetical protein
VQTGRLPPRPSEVSDDNSLPIKPGGRLVPLYALKLVLIYLRFVRGTHQNPIRCLFALTQSREVRA